MKKGERTANLQNLDSKEEDSGSSMIMGMIKKKLSDKPTPIPKEEDDDPIASAWNKGEKTAKFPPQQQKAEEEENEGGSMMLMSRIKKNVEAKVIPKEEPKVEKKNEEDDDPIAKAWKKGEKTATLPPKEEDTGSNMLMSRIKKNLEGKTVPKEEPKPEPKDDEHDDPIAKAWKKGEKTATLPPQEEEDSGSNMLMSRIKKNLGVKPTPKEEPK
jgi:hypothetical protein